MADREKARAAQSIAERRRRADDDRGEIRFAGLRELLMKARISVLTIGVSDLERSLIFYRDGLGLPTEGILGREFEHGAVAFFALGGGLRLAIWSQDDIAYDTGQRKTPMS